MKTHYVRLRRPPRSELDSPAESIVLAAVPLDRLVTVTDVFDVVAAAFRKEAINPPSQQGVANMLAKLAEREFVKEVVGVRLEAMLGL
jgi:Tat protein secretion system quality control protein TatD with DNase activity